VVGEAEVTAAAAAAPAVPGRCRVEAASLQRCFGLANGVDLLYATLGRAVQAGSFKLVSKASMVSALETRIS